MAGIPSAQEPIADRTGKVTTRWRAWLASVAGVFGAVTVSRKILFVQTLPALIALIGVWLA